LTGSNHGCGAKKTISGGFKITPHNQIESPADTTQQRDTNNERGNNKKSQEITHDRLLQNNSAMLEYLKSKDGVRRNVR
jgi:hypothetical protein